MTVALVPFVARTYEDDVRFELQQVRAERAAESDPRKALALDRHVCRLERLLEADSG